MINFIDPCFDNTVKAQTSLSFVLTDQVTFAPESVSDNYSVDNDLEGLCGAVEPTSFSCQDFTSTEAFLDANTGKATI